MNRGCIAIVDVTRARICEYDVRSAPGNELKEIADLVNLGRRHVGEMFASARGGERAGDTGKPSQRQEATDDHRQGYAEERDQKFAHEVVTTLARIAHEGAFTDVVVVAGPRMLGELRRHEAALRHDGLHLEEIERDLAWQSNAQLHDHLADLGVIPPRQRIAASP